MTIAIGFDIETRPLPDAVIEERLSKIRVPVSSESFDAIFAINQANTGPRETEEETKNEQNAFRAESLANFYHERRRSLRLQQIEQATLKAHLSEICCVGLYSEKRDPPDRVLWTDDFGDAGEAGLLRELSDVFSKVGRSQGGRIFSAGGEGFDLPYLWRRGLANRFRFCDELPFFTNGRFWNDCFVDVLKVWQGPQWSSVPPIGADALAKTLGFEGKTEDIGATFWEIAKNDRDRAESYVVADARIAYQVGMVFESAEKI